ncbi:MAG: CYTH domain-containing protein [Magnetococcales bacterium]|nr:CYTH domain-containing protein [Magnetococcales bacterium]
MAKEIERKFLVRGEAWRHLGEVSEYRQGFLSTVRERVVRVRIAGDKGTLTIKGVTRGVTRSEFEYPIPLEDARILLQEICERPLIEKKRHRIPQGELVWEVDEFFGENEGLILAEVELRDEHQEVTLPDWVGREVSDDPRYFNANLVANPFKNWGKS